MAGGAVSGDGADLRRDSATDDSGDTGTRNVVYSGGRGFVYNRDSVLSVEKDEVQPRCLAFVCNRRNG